MKNQKQVSNFLKDTKYKYKTPSFAERMINPKKIQITTRRAKQEAKPIYTIPKTPKVSGLKWK